MTSRLPLPEGVLQQHTIILGKTGSGKSSVGRLMVEHLLGQMRGPALLDLVNRVTIIDPKGDWWGIKSSANGRDGGLPVAIFGGEHAEVPITPNSGAAVAKIATETAIPVLIDLGGWMVSEKTRFFLDFAPVYYRASGPRHLMVDEAHQFAPKGKIPDPQVGKMLHWMNTIAGEGRGRGITLIAASQRPQKVHNDLLTQCETLIAMRVIHPADMRAYRDWIEGAGDLAIGKEVLATVAGLPKGTAWVWSPEIGFGPTKVAFPKYWTYDSFKPQVDTKPLKGWHEVDLSTLKEQFAAEIRQAEQNDPRLLHKRIRELEQMIAKAGAPPDVSPAMARAEFERGVATAAAVEVSRIKEQASKDHRVLAPLVGILDGVRMTLQEHCERLLRPPEPPPPVVVTSAPARLEPLPRVQLRSHYRPPQPALEADVVDDSGLTKGQHKILNALAWLIQAGITEPSREQVSAIANYRGGAYTRALGNLKTRGMVDCPPGRVVLTGAGAHHAVSDGAGTMEQRWSASLRTEGQRKIFAALLRAADEGPVTRDALSELADYRGGAFTRALGTLKTMGAVEFPGAGHVMLSRWVRP